MFEKPQCDYVGPQLTVLPWVPLLCRPIGPDAPSLYPSLPPLACLLFLRFALLPPPQACTLPPSAHHALPSLSLTPSPP